MKEIKKPAFMEQAMNKQGHNLFLEMLLIFAVYFIGTMLSSVVQLPAMAVYLFQSKEYIQMLKGGGFDTEKMLQIMFDMPEWMGIVMLFGQLVLILVFILYCRIFEKRKAVTMGFRKKGFLLEYGKGIVYGLLLLAASYGICMLTGSMTLKPAFIDRHALLMLAGYLIGYLIQGMAVEVIFRGCLLVSLSRRYSVFSSVLITSVFFVMMYGSGAGATSITFLNVFLLSIFLSLLFLLTENIWIVAAFHGIWNFIQGSVFGIAGSSASAEEQTSLFHVYVDENLAVINGGNSTIVSGMAVTLLLLVAVGLVWYLLGRRGKLTERETFMQRMERTLKEAEQQQREAQAAQPDFTNPVPKESGRENMGLSKDETPWHPTEAKVETENPSLSHFDAGYFSMENDTESTTESETADENPAAPLEENKSEEAKEQMTKED